MTTLHLIAILAASTCAAACAADPDLGCIDSAGIVYNGRHLNGAQINGRSLDGASLDSVSLDGEGDGCRGDADLTTLECVVGCALTPDQAIAVPVADGESVVLRGALGLAPEWADGPCDETCQGWVSSCLIATSPAGATTSATSPAVATGPARSTRPWSRSTGGPRSPTASPPLAPARSPLLDLALGGSS